MAARARRNHPRPPARRGGAAYQRARPTIPFTNGFSVQILSPVNGFHSRDRRPDITVVGVSSLLSPVDLQIEWRTTKAVWTGTAWTPTPTYTSEFLDSVSGSPQVMEPPTDLAYFTWWYRARAGDKDTNTWSEWSPQYFLDVYPILGSATEYIDLNIGVLQPVVLDTATAYLDMNIGVFPHTELTTLVSYLDINVGVMEHLKIAAEYLNLNIYQPTGEYQAAIYADLNMVSDETPVPHIWWVRPEQGKEGYVFNIFGHGFGEFQNQYDGIVKLGNLTCAIARWEVVPRSALTDADLRIIRGMGLDPDEITVEHGWVVAIVPTGAVSSMVQVVLEDD